MQHAADDDVTVREVEDARGAQRVRKLPTARWVAGLTPEAPNQPAASAPAATGGFPQRDWLRDSVWWLSLSALHAFIPGDVNNSELAFPLTEVGSLQALDLAAPWSIVAAMAVHIFVAIGTARLGLKLGAATHSFANFLAFGVSVLTIVAAIGEAVLLFGACTWFRRTAECFLPFVFHWLVSVFVRFGPAIANVMNMLGIAAAPAVCKHIGLPGLMMVIVTSLPAFYLVFGFASAWWQMTQEPLTQIAPVAFKMTAGTALFSAWAVGRVPPFKALEAKPHSD